MQGDLHREIRDPQFAHNVISYQRGPLPVPVSLWPGIQSFKNSLISHPQRKLYAALEAGLRLIRRGTHTTMGRVCFGV